MDSPQPRVDPLLGRTLDGRYQIHGLIGEGGMGAVYRATHLLMGKACAIKVLRGPAAARERAGKRFRREAQSASRLDHEHCIRVTDFGITDDGLMYLVMELLDGKSLAEELVLHGALPVPRVAALAAQIAEALAHAHGLGIVHRDLKPDNIFLCARPRGEFVKVLDFGLAKILEGEASRGSPSTLSELGSVFGTPEYMSPEQAEARPLDARSDLYSFGCLLYQMLTGQLPFQAGSVVAVLTKQMTEAPVSPAARRPDLSLPEPLVSLCLRCLEKDPRRRPPSARWIADELGRLDLGARIPPRIAALETMELETAPAAPRRGRLWLLFAAGAATGTAAVVVGVILSSRPAPPPVSSAPAAAPARLDARPAASVPDASTRAAAVADADAGASPAAAEERPPAPTPSTTTRVADHLRDAARYRAQGNRLRELYHLQQAVRLDPGHPTANLRLGSALLEDGQRELACARFARAGNIARSLYESASCAVPAPH